MPCSRAASMASMTSSAVSARERREDAAAVEPAHAFLPEDAFPVDVAGLELRRRRVAAVRAADRAADAEALLGEVEPDARGAADAVERHPLDVRQVHAALQHQVLQQPADLVVHEAR